MFFYAYIYMGDIMGSIKNYIFEKDFEIRIANNYTDIINYKDILNFDDNSISITDGNKKIIIKGSLLSISKLLDNELLITGKIDSIDFI